jgi:general secretion pathway protein H
MPTSVTGTSVSSPPRSISAGFTLIEIMIVVFIIGLISAAAVITFGGQSRDSELDREAERLEALLDYAREQAELQTRDYGFRTTRFGYQFVVFDPLKNEWEIAQEDDALRERKLPDGLVPTLAVEGRPIVLPGKWPKLDDFKPQVMIFGNGDLSSFEWTLTREESRAVARIATDEQTALLLQLPGDAKARTAAERAEPEPAR